MKLKAKKQDLKYFEKLFFILKKLEKKTEKIGFEINFLFKKTG